MQMLFRTAALLSVSNHVNLVISGTDQNAFALWKYSVGNGTAITTFYCAIRIVAVLEVLSL